jgi:hypothetical protein
LVEPFNGQSATSLQVALELFLEPTDLEFQCTSAATRMDEVPVSLGDHVGWSSFSSGERCRQADALLTISGFHGTLQTEEALKHADAYKADKLHDLKDLPSQRHEPSPFATSGSRISTSTPDGTSSGVRPAISGIIRPMISRQRVLWGLPSR